MVDLPDPGRQGMRALALCGWMFCTTSLVLFLVAISLPSWSVAKEGSTDGKLGLFSFCPDTWHFLNSTVLQELNRTKMQAGCVPVDRFCEVRLVRPGFLLNVLSESSYVLDFDDLSFTSEVNDIHR